MNKGDRIVDAKGRNGYVLKKTAKKITMILDGGEKLLAGVSQCFHSSTAKHEPKAQKIANAKFKKGDRVKTKQGGKYVHGIISRGGTAACVMIQDGGRYEVKGPPHIFELSNEPLATDNEPPSPMDKYEVKKYKPAPQVSEETLAFSAEIWFEGKPFLHAQNQGTGGCNMYYPIGDYKGRNAEMQFDIDAKEWAKINGAAGNLHEVGDLWISWYTEQRPYGTSAKQHWSEWNDFFDNRSVQRPES